MNEKYSIEVGTYKDPIKDPIDGETYNLFINENGRLFLRRDNGVFHRMLTDPKKFAIEYV